MLLGKSAGHPWLDSFTQEALVAPPSTKLWVWAPATLESHSSLRLFRPYAYSASLDYSITPLTPMTRSGRAGVVAAFLPGGFL